MDFLFSICQDNINSCEKSLDYIDKYVEIVRVVKSEKHPDFLTGVNNLGMVLLEQGFNEKALEIFINLNAWYYTDETFPYIQKMVGH
jgi:hypothetical protein